MREGSQGSKKKGDFRCRIPGRNVWDLEGTSGGFCFQREMRAHVLLRREMSS